MADPMYFLTRDDRDTLSKFLADLRSGRAYSQLIKPSYYDDYSEAIHRASDIVIVDVPSDLAAGAAADDFQVWDTNADAADNYTINALPPPDSELKAGKHPAGMDRYGNWRILGGGGGGDPYDPEDPETHKPAFLIWATLAEDSGGTGGGGTSYGARSSSATAHINPVGQVPLSPEPYVLYTAQSEVKNSLGLNGLSGDRCLLGYDVSDGTYFLQNVFPLKRKILFNATEDRPHGLNQSFDAAIVLGLEVSGEFSGTAEIKDPFNVAINIKSGHRGTARWIQSYSGYVVEACDRQATEATALVTADFDEDDTTVSVDTVVGVDGDAPVFGSGVDVKNRFKRFGKVGYKCWLKYDNSTGEWILLQIECEEMIEPI